MIPTDSSKLRTTTKYIPFNADELIYDDSEWKNFLISFQFYDYKGCGIQNLDQGGAKKLVRSFKAIGLSNINNLKNNDYLPIQMEPVEDNGHYAKYYNQTPAPKEITVFHHDISHVGRLFYFTIKNKFYILAITSSKHDENKKHKKNKRYNGR